MHPRDHKLARRMMQAKRDARMSWIEIARRSGYSRFYLRCIADGTRPNITVACAAAIAGATGVDPAWLVGWKD